MFTRIFLFFAAFIAGIAILVSVGFSNFEPSVLKYDPVKGQNNTILFLSNSELGIANVHVATSEALLIHHHDIQLHFASFPARPAVSKAGLSVANLIEHISENVPKHVPGASTIKFHELSSPSWAEALTSRKLYPSDMSTPPGLAGIAKFCKDIEMYLMPWSGPEYYAIYKQISKIIDKVNPAVIAVDQTFGPAVDAIKAKKRKYAVISPNSLKDNFGLFQPLGSFLWKYPALGSGYPYPVPWHLIPANVYLNLRIFYSVWKSPALNAKKKYLEERGISNPNDLINVYNKNMTWITQSHRVIDFPLSVIPENVKVCGSIYLDWKSSKGEGDALLRWIATTPTILINSGSLAEYSPDSALEMARALSVVLYHTNVQVLWRISHHRYFNATDDFLHKSMVHLKDYRKAGRVIVTPDLSFESGALLKTGNIIVSVHHGGANSYHEAAANGVPQVVLPMWAHHYDYAARVEYLEIGVHGSKGSAPNWTAGELASSIMTVLNDVPPGRWIRETATYRSWYFADPKSGRRCAAEELAKLARVDEV
ncbi:UDP-Glycosyltransferase/glycogen phosphorylase [Microthyrium microscopicum]|uniref:UDP-Glycosyltransferase/glycogen phosphorylase n=1 Tax=Microthyrium microscopicum TaxID=703497 RepID=A0A6A6U4J8_9PEZI|nr:UDP-Glycosyltransferase/glycogen phosphorylase [Microthyrium microscopicum]